jgi:hypothetical protein
MAACSSPSSQAEPGAPMRMIDPRPEIVAFLTIFGIGGIICQTYPYPYPLHAPKVIALNYLPNNNAWCDRYGWTPIDEQTCKMLRWWPSSIPLPLDGHCPYSYELWTYDHDKPAICVRRA